MKERIRLKICGLRTEESVLTASRIGPDFLGFIFYPGSPRYVGPDHRWIQAVQPGKTCRKVGVFVNEDFRKILDICQYTGIDMVQLHGQESPELCNRLQGAGIGVIKVFSVGEGLEPAQMLQFTGKVDYFLFDTRGKYLGGNGIPFDWSILQRYDLPVPFFLSGGIGPDNIGHVKYLNHPKLFAVDVNSRLESEPGIKDRRLLEIFKKAFEKVDYE